MTPNPDHPNPDPSRPFINEWLKLPNGKRFYLTTSYLQGCYDAQENRPPRPRIASPKNVLYGPQVAQYTYGYNNEKAGLHDHLDLPPYPSDLIEPTI